MSNKEKFLGLASTEDTNTMAKVKARIKNRAMLRESQKIALKVLMKLDELGWSQKDLATALSVSPQQVTKIVSGKENLTIDTQIKLQNILKIPVLASYYETGAMEELILTIRKGVEKIEARKNDVAPHYEVSKIVKMECRPHTHKHEYYPIAV